MLYITTDLKMLNAAGWKTNGLYLLEISLWPKEIIEEKIN